MLAITEYEISEIEHFIAAKTSMTCKIIFIVVIS